MTNKEAENVLHTMASLIEFHGVKQEHILEFREAYEMAIEALGDRPTGKWEIGQVEAVNSAGEIYHFNGDSAWCPFCNNVVGRKGISIQDRGYFPKYCDECGTRLEDSEDVEND